ncbi:MAG TPA: RICIN domain-containing protein [Pseudonocardiaceae bacterium]|jgi:hypothetical protein|nr:RICIN domain-containing protein [Pseudonocardiaceae bacterium]
MLLTFVGAATMALSTVFVGSASAATPGAQAAVVAQQSGSATRYVLSEQGSAIAPGAIPPGSEVFQLRNGANHNLCLDAKTQDGGVNGNTVQLFTCLGTGQLNQFWWPRTTTNGFTELVNVAYQSKCLDADNAGGLAVGKKVQLWDCFNDSVGHASQWWDFGPGDGATFTTLPNLGGNGSFVLDAATQTIGNGGRVQIWTFNGGNNQFWRQ